MMNETLKRRIESLPHAPGVYLMKDGEGRILCVGKAADLNRRVRSYFEEGGGDERPFIPLLGPMVEDVETMVTDNEKEALILENELIKQHRPRFNIKLREGGTFVFLRDYLKRQD